MNRFLHYNNNNSYASVHNKGFKIAFLQAFIHYYSLVILFTNSELFKHYASNISSITVTNIFIQGQSSLQKPHLVYFP